MLATKRTQSVPTNIRVISALTDPSGSQRGLSFWNHPSVIGHTSRLCHRILEDPKRLRLIPQACTVRPRERAIPAPRARSGTARYLLPPKLRIERKTKAPLSNSDYR